MDRCNCNKQGGDLQIQCNLEIMRFNNMPGNFNDRTGDFQNANRNKRELVYSDDIIYLYDDEKPTEHMHFSRRKRAAVQTKMSLENATEYCRKKILDTDAAKVCLEVTGINATGAIQACAEDLKVSTTLQCIDVTVTGQTVHVEKTPSVGYKKAYFAHQLWRKLNNNYLIKSNPQ